METWISQGVLLLRLWPRLQVQLYKQNAPRKLPLQQGKLQLLGLETYSDASALYTLTAQDMIRAEDQLKQ